MKDFDTRLQDFSDNHWPCEYQDKKIHHCANTKTRHAKGHQDLHSGKVAPKGRYESKFSPESYARSWFVLLQRNIRELERKLRVDEQERRFPGKDALSLHSGRHRNILRSFYKTVGGASRYTHHPRCLSCFMRPPQFPLACGHVLCAKCAEVFGRKDNNSICIASCPLHEGRWANEWKIKLKPKFAGVRILSLDGYVDPLVEELIVAVEGYAESWNWRLSVKYRTCLVSTYRLSSFST
jgi:hypothetical protein